MGRAAAAALLFHLPQLVLIVSLAGASGGRLAQVSAQPRPVFACAAAGSPPAAGGGLFPFCNVTLGIEARVLDLVSRLTLDEKVGFLPSKSGAVPRLGIPSYEWWSEALHGVSYVGPGTRFAAGLVPGATSFPQVIHTAASFNTTLFYAIGTVVSTEARAMYNVGLAGLTFWSPNVNIFRDPRWGRGQETPGEDPLLSSKYAAAYVRGLQDAGEPNRLKVAACCKHYTAYDVDNWKGIQRYTFNAQVTKQDLDDTYQPPFKSCVVDGNVASVMCSYNKVNGVPTCADPDLLAGTVRGSWKLNGYIVSDCDSVDVIYNSQHYTKKPEEAAAKTILAGLDLNCGSFLGQHTKDAVAGNLLRESDVDQAITNNLATLMRLGFFDGDPGRGPYGGLGAADVCTTEHQDLARQAARQGVVVLKNGGSALPLSPTATASLAVVGPNANATKTMLGNYEGTPCSYVTPLQGLTAVVPATVYQPGCLNVACAANNLRLDAAKQAAAAADATVLIMGTDQSVERESLDRVDLTLPGQQELLITEVAKVSKGPLILVLMSGGPFDVTFAKNNEKISGIIWVGFPGEKGGAALADVIFGYYNPSGRLPVTWYPQSFTSVPMTDMNMRPNSATGYPGRTYRFYTGDVVYSFGDGLSYTTFQHRLVRAPEMVAIPLDAGHACRARRCRSVELLDGHCRGLVFDVHVRVQNAGEVAGGHTVFLFSAPPAVHKAPRKHLVAFEKVALGPMEAGDVVFKVDVCRDLGLVDEMGVRKVALGPHVLHVGSLTHSLKLKI